MIVPSPNFYEPHSRTVDPRGHAVLVINSRRWNEGAVACRAWFRVACVRPSVRLSVCLSDCCKYTDCALASLVDNIAVQLIMTRGYFKCTQITSAKFWGSRRIPAAAAAAALGRNIPDLTANPTVSPRCTEI